MGQIYIVQAQRILAAVLLAALWIVAVPYCFAVLYSVLELQSAARAAAGSNSKLATYLVMTRATQIETLTKKIPELQAAADSTASEYSQKLDDWYSARDRLIDELALAAAKVPGMTFDPVTCLHQDNVSDHDALLKCAQPILQANAIKDGASAPLAPGAVDQSFSAQLSAALLNFEDVNRRVDAALDGRNIAQREFSDASNSLRKLVGVSGDTLLSGLPVESPTSAPNASPPAQSASSATSSDTPTNDIGAVATSYNDLKSVRLFAVLFQLPAGAVVAFFTGLMGAIGAGVYSLLRSMGAGLDAKRPDLLLLDFAARPVLGALAGFMVFFVVSAGAAFLVQPGAASATDAVNSLSPSALASLGVFAGIAAESALRWLNSKAVAFFEIADEPKTPTPAPAE
jgi:hypothetical protein